MIPSDAYRRGGHAGDAFESGGSGQGIPGNPLRRAVAMHWGTFQLTDEPLGEPPILLKKALRESSLAEEVFEVVEVGCRKLVMPAGDGGSSRISAG